MKDKLMEKIVQICDEAGVFYDSKDSIAFDNLVNKLLALISQERERLLKEVDKEIENEEYWDSEGWEADNYDSKIFNTVKFSKWLEQRKALSDIGGKDE